MTSPEFDDLESLIARAAWPETRPEFDRNMLGTIEAIGPKQIVSNEPAKKNSWRYAPALAVVLLGMNGLSFFLGQQLGQTTTLRREAPVRSLELVQVREKPQAGSAWSELIGDQPPAESVLGTRTSSFSIP